MQKVFENYIQSISSKFTHQETSEMGYRTDFEILLKQIFESLNNIHIFHDSKAIQGNKPDFVIVKDKIPLLYIEVKDFGISLDKIEKSEQMSRYFGYANLILSDYTEFRFYRNGERYEEPIKIADYDIKIRAITPISKNYEYLARTILEFTQSHKEPIKSANHLAKIMGGKGQRIRDNIRQFLSISSERNVDLLRIYESLKTQLVHDMTEFSFADMYAQTLVYGLFVARYNDETPNSFSRQEARDLIPKSNPLLRHFFDHIAGPEFDDRLEYIIDELCEVYSHANVSELMKEYTQKNLWGDQKIGKDPVIHFYEDFLKEYDPELRQKMGAYYTPLPVVQFIVRSVDEILKKDFGLLNGLADTSKDLQGRHIVQILDPAVGTGTFISNIIRQIYESLKKNGQDGRWPAYVQNDLLPRLHGFELMMTPYTIAHLKLSIAFKQTGFKYFNNKRLGIYLTNTLEENSSQKELFSGLGFANSIAEEAKEASKIKNDTPIMVVMGNPPYSVSSSNKGKWILKLIEDYKQGLNEKNIQPLSDDYIKFIRFAEHYIEKNGTGIVAMITNNSFLDGTIHRQMRKHLLESFDDIYILNLHGNSKKKEKDPNGGRDENVFKIQQGVSINIFIKKQGSNTELGSVHYSELYGKKEQKFAFLDESSLESIEWKILDYSSPLYFFIPKNFSLRTEYEKGFKIDDLFQIYNAGSATGKDSIFVDIGIDGLTKKLNSSNIDFAEKNIVDYLYRPFDSRKVLYDNALIQRLRKQVMDHMKNQNIALLTCKTQTSFDFQHVFISKFVTDRCSVSLQTGEVSYVFPLYLYSENGIKTSNMKDEITDMIKGIIGSVSPEEIFDYIYAVLHSPIYRDKYKEFLKIDFPRIPYPKDSDTFKKLVELGKELRLIHLLESPKVNQYITTYPVSGSDLVEKLIYKDGNVYINFDQYFGNVPELVWNFYIGGYQPAQKWLKDRKGRVLTNEDIEHYQKIIVALSETGRIMEEIDSTYKNL